MNAAFFRPQIALQLRLFAPTGNLRRRAAGDKWLKMDRSDSRSEGLVSRIRGRLSLRKPVPERTLAIFLCYALRQILKIPLCRKMDQTLKTIFKKFQGSQKDPFLVSALIFSIPLKNTVSNKQTNAASSGTIFSPFSLTKLQPVCQHVLDQF